MTKKPKNQEKAASTLPTRSAGAPAGPNGFAIVTGLLGQAGALALVQREIEAGGSAATVAVEVDGEEVGQLVTRIGPAGPRTRYLVVSASLVRNVPALHAAVGRRLVLDDLKQVALHRVVAALALSADLSGLLGEADVHHVNLDGGDNRAENLWVLSKRLHDAVHDHIDRDREGYLAALGSGADPALLFPAELWAEVVADRRLFEGWGEARYNALRTRSFIHDLSLSFEGGRMIMSGAFAKVVAAVDGQGEPRLDRAGRQAYEVVVQTQTATSDGLLVGPEDPMPPLLVPHRPFQIEDLFGEARWSRGGMAAFRRGDAPIADLAKRLSGAIDRVAAFARPVDLAIVVAFIASTYLFPLAPRALILAFRSMSPGSGKSRALEAIARSAFNAHLVGVSSLALLPRLVDLARCTLVLDEAEKLASRQRAGDLIEVLNSRTDAGTSYKVMDRTPDGFVPRSFYLFGPTVIANLGGLTPTLESRAITIEMRALRPNELERQNASVAAAADWGFLRDQLALWAGRYWQDVQLTYATDPAVRVGSNRQMDLWRLLLAVARHFGEPAMFEALHAAATAAAAAPKTDDRADVVAVALMDAVIRAPHPGSPIGVPVAPGPVRIALQSVVARAQEALEADQRNFLGSKHVAAFCRALGLEVRRSAPGGANEVWINDPAALLTALAAQFPHLGTPD